VSRILIVEGEERISSFIAKGLRAEGFTPPSSPTVSRASTTP
jgi:DNA-binding response OmpR family regulator